MEDQAWENMKSSSIRMVYVATYTLVTWTIMIFGLNYAANNVAHRIRILYFEKALEKDAAYYDAHNPTEMASKISKECSVITSGAGQKYGHIIQGYSNCIVGLIFAFIFGWLMSAILFVAFPIMGIIMTFQGQVQQRSTKDVMKAYS